MNIEKIHEIVKESKWQPKFQWEHIKETAVSINLGHEDFPMLVDSTVTHISLHNGKRSFSMNDMFAIQGGLLHRKKDLLGFYKYMSWDIPDKLGLRVQPHTDLMGINDERREAERYLTFGGLPNRYVKPGFRDIIDVKVGGFTPPHVMFLKVLLEEIFPVNVVAGELTYPCKKETVSLEEDIVLWYKLFETIHPLNDLNGRTGGIIAALLSNSSHTNMYYTPIKTI